MADSLSLEETNALRAKLGLAPLGGDDDQETVDPDKEAYDNFQKMKRELQKEKEAEEIRARIEKSKNRKKNLEKLEGRGLGDADNDSETSALEWIKRSRKREKELAARRARELDEMDQTFEKYDAEDLSGLKVAHDLTEFHEGSEMILTLKDRGILDEEEGGTDELSNVQLEDRERLRKNLENKKKKSAYNPYDDEEFILGGIKKSMLPQYDEDKKPEGFEIGKGGKINVMTEEEKQQSVAQKLKEQTLSYEKMQEIKDYYTQDEVNLSFKKPKKKKKKEKLRKRIKDNDDEDALLPPATTNGEHENVSPSTSAQPARKTIDMDVNFVDDDDLQQSLARTRQAANRKRAKEAKKMTPEEIARSIVEQRQAAAAAMQEDTDQANDEGGESGLVLSEITEFVNSLGETPTFVTHEPQRSAHVANEHTPMETKSVTPEPHVEQGEETPVHIKDVSDNNEGPAPEEVEEDASQPQDEGIPLIEEPLVSKGLAATLSLLNQKGLVAKPTEEQLKNDRRTAERMKWLAEQKKRDIQRERERQIEKQRQRERDGRASSASNRDRERAREREREREREKELEEREMMRQFEKRMEEYKPDVKLEYFDEYGRQMDTKEAFRFMSHKFHGKTSGKAKTEKRMQKMQEELKLNMMSSSDTPLNLATKLLERQQRTGTAHVVLSVGNRGVVAPDMPNFTAPSAAGSSKSASGKRSREDEAGGQKKKR
ncbi:SART-1 protein [Dichotomocladium elegans]|nr:SART-1 protein [Dichotomocladium elegans]